MIIGDTARLAFDLTWPVEERAEVAGLGWGALRLWVGGRRAWSTNDHQGVEWTWVDLVEHLARAWGHLHYEENAPFGLVAFGPEHLRDPRLLASVPGHESHDVEEAVHAYQHRHDLAAGLKGITLPPVWILPVGRSTRVRFDRRELSAPHHEISHTLASFVEAVIERVRNAPAPRASAAIARWHAREPSPERVRTWRTTLGAATLRAWTPQDQTTDAYWGFDDADSPMMAAARLSQPLDAATRIALLGAIASLPRAYTPELDRLSTEAVPVVGVLADKRPYEQGQALALWLRSKLGVPDAPVDPEALLRGWGVLVDDLPPQQSELDAAACWSGARGPAVWVNPAGKHAQSAAGRRATLAHEVAHLLLDRAEQLPAVEIFGGSTPLHLEQRARAFAAELLLPREVAGRELAKTANLSVAHAHLMQVYGVSREIVGWQLKNGPGWELLNRAERLAVSGWCKTSFPLDR